MRKEVHLDEENEIFWLQKAADKKKWSLKKYMEFVLQVDAERIKNRYAGKVHSDSENSK